MIRFTRMIRLLLIPAVILVVPGCTALIFAIGGGAGGGGVASVIQKAVAACLPATSSSPGTTSPASPPATGRKPSPTPPATRSPAPSTQPTPRHRTPRTPTNTRPPAPQVADIPPTYLQLYRSAGARYGLDWSILAGVGSVESTHGTDPNTGVSSGDNGHGAAGPMQIGIGGASTNNWGGAPRHPASQRTGGVAVDGNNDGWADVYDPADAIPGAAVYLRREGGPANMRAALYAYNHDWSYVALVLARARRYAAAARAAGLPVPSPGDATLPPGAAGTCPPELAAALGLNPDATVGPDGQIVLPPGTPANIRKVIAYAESALGTPYKFSGNCISPFKTEQQRCDCSSLVMRAYAQVGVQLPRTADAQVKWGQTHGQTITYGQESTGDLVAYNSYLGTGTIGHIGIVIDGRRQLMINAPNTGSRVRIESYAEKSRKPLFRIVRLLQPRVDDQ